MFSYQNGTNAEWLKNLTESLIIPEEYKDAFKASIEQKKNSLKSWYQTDDDSYNENRILTAEQPNNPKKDHFKGIDGISFADCC